MDRPDLKRKFKRPPPKRVARKRKYAVEYIRDCGPELGKRWVKGYRNMEKKDAEAALERLKETSACEWRISPDPYPLSNQDLSTCEKAKGAS